VREPQAMYMLKTLYKLLEVIARHWLLKSAWLAQHNEQVGLVGWKNEVGKGQPAEN
jgi:hypothetical protein